IMIEGNLTGICGIVKDITGTKIAEQARRESEETFRIIAENSVDIIKVLTPDGKITYVSPSIEAILGYSTREIAGKSYFDLIHPADTNKLDKAISRLFETKEHVEVEVRRKHQEGYSVWLHSDLIPVLDSE